MRKSPYSLADPGEGGTARFILAPSERAAKPGDGVRIGGVGRGFLPVGGRDSLSEISKSDVDAETTRIFFCTTFGKTWNPEKFPILMSEHFVKHGLNLNLHATPIPNRCR